MASFQLHHLLLIFGTFVSAIPSAKEYGVRCYFTYTLDGKEEHCQEYGPDGKMGEKQIVPHVNHQEQDQVPEQDAPQEETVERPIENNDEIQHMEFAEETQVQHEPEEDLDYAQDYDQMQHEMQPQQDYEEVQQVPMHQHAIHQPQLPIPQQYHHQQQQPMMMLAQGSQNAPGQFLQGLLIKHSPRIKMKPVNFMYAG